MVDGVFHINESPNESPFGRTAARQANVVLDENRRFSISSAVHLPVHFLNRVHSIVSMHPPQTYVPQRGCEKNLLSKRGENANCCAPLSIAHIHSRFESLAPKREVEPKSFGWAGYAKLE